MDVFAGLGVEASWDTLNEVVEKLVEKSVPETGISHGVNRQFQYLNQTCLAAIKKKKPLWLKFENSKNQTDYNKYRQASKNVKTEIRRQTYTYEKNLVVKINSDSKLFCSFVQSRQKTKTSLGCLELPNREITADDKTRANLLNGYFTSVFEEEGNDPLPDFPDREFDDVLVKLEITEEKNAKVIDSLKQTIWNGKDTFHPKLLKNVNLSF